MSKITVIKRNGDSVKWSLERITRAICLALYSLNNNEKTNFHKDSSKNRYGLTQKDFDQAVDLACQVQELIFVNQYKSISIEEIQDVVESVLVKNNLLDLVFQYKSYRIKRASRKLKTHDQTVMSDYIVQSKYARYIPELKRREIFPEIVSRPEQMHLKTFSSYLSHNINDPQINSLGIYTLKDAIETSFNDIRNKNILPAMRSLQFGGAAIEANNARMYNCSASPLNRISFFKEYFFLLLSGCGCGFSVQKHHISQLPVFPKRQVKDYEIYTIPDSIEGWALSIDKLIHSYLNNYHVTFDYSLIRPEGSPLKTSGGKAPGPEGLKQCHINVSKILDNVNERQLKTIEAYDICMYISDAVLSGGIRRSASICLFSPDDQDMQNAKTGDWTTNNLQRSNSNNSAALLRDSSNEEHFLKLFESQKKFGEPGFYFTSDLNYLPNPCVTDTTWTLTANGPDQVKNLIGVPFKAMVNGEPHPSEGFFKTGTKDVYILTTNEGHSLELTKDHKVLVAVNKKRALVKGTKHTKKPVLETEWKEAQTLTPGDQIVLHNHSEINWDGSGGTPAEGWLLGSLLGDSNTHNGIANLDFWGEQKEHLSSHSQSSLKEVFSQLLSITPAEKYDRCRISSKDLFNLSSTYGITTSSNKNLLPSIEKTSSSFYEAFLRGWFDADGSVQGTQEHGVSVSLCSNNLHNLTIAQRMLLRLGINSVIYQERRPEGQSLLPDGKGSYKLYDTKATHELVISNSNLEVFRHRIGFEDSSKLSHLDQLLSNYKRNLNTELFTATFKDLTFVATVDVYDCTVPGPHAFDGNGLYIHNCVEIALHPYINWDLTNSEKQYLQDQGVDPNKEMSGWQFCNLTTINGSLCNTPEKFYRACILATIVGTLQSYYTDVPFIGPISKLINDRDRLLGVSICGVMNNPQILLNPEILQKGAQICKQVNLVISKLLGINPAARITCVKPEGTASLVLNSGSGIHAEHFYYYFRRVTAKFDEPVFNYFKKYNPSLIEKSTYKDKTYYVMFPVQPDSRSLTKESMNPLTFLETVKLVQTNWVLPGTNPNRSPNAFHNVSNTCTVPDIPEMWDKVRDYIWKNRYYFTGISLLQASGDKLYKHAPRESVTTKEDEELWNNMQVTKVDYTQMVEEDDNTSLKETVACAGGACEIV